MNPRQQRKVEILTRLDSGALDVVTAAELLGVGARHVRRLHERFRHEGFEVAIHGNSGQPPVNRTDPSVVEQILVLAGPDGKYHDWNVCHLCDMLDQEMVKIGRSTLDRLLKQAGLRQGSEKASVHRRRRVRRPAEGMMLQMDGSPFEWLEERGPKASLTGAVDDATGKIVFLVFRPTEDQAGYLLLLRTVAQSHGLPMSIYHDRHTILRSPKQQTLEEELAGQVPMSQIQRVMAELGIESIAAHSPQAKGRIERLWGTLQDRLTKELRLAGITTLQEANNFLPGFIGRYNAHFAKAPQDPNSAWVPLPAEFDLNYYFAVRETRRVRSDNCISWSGQLLQLMPDPTDPSLVNETITVHVVPEGTIHLYHGKRSVRYRPVSASDPVLFKPLKHPRQPARSSDPQSAARRRGWLFASR